MSHLSSLCQCPRTVPNTLKSLRALHEVKLYNEAKARVRDVGGRQAQKKQVQVPGDGGGSGRFGALQNQLRWEMNPNR